MLCRLLSQVRKLREQAGSQGLGTAEVRSAALQRTCDLARKAVVAVKSPSVFLALLGRMFVEVSKSEKLRMNLSGS